jgi:hypothetical protein
VWWIRCASLVIQQGATTKEMPWHFRGGGTPLGARGASEAPHHWATHH